MSDVKIGLIGLGNVGGCYAHNLLGNFAEVLLYDADCEKTKGFAQTSARCFTSGTDLAREADVIVLALPNPDVVRAVLLGRDGVLCAAQKGSLIIDISTIDPDTARDLYAAAKAQGVDYLEAPMSGGEPSGAGHFGAQKGLITFMVGGDEGAFTRGKPVFDALGKHAIHLGEAGRGNAVKLISNHIAGLYMATMAEGFVLGSAMGIDAETLFKVFQRTDAQSFTMFEEFQPHLMARNYDDGFPVELMHKDHRLAGELARKYNVPMPLNATVMELYQTAMAHGMGRKSHAAIVESMADVSDVTLKVGADHGAI